MVRPDKEKKEAELKSRNICIVLEYPVQVLHTRYSDCQDPGVARNYPRDPESRTLSGPGVMDRRYTAAAHIPVHPLRTLASELHHSPPSHPMEPPSPRGPLSQDTLNAREKRVSCDRSYPAQIWGDAYPSNEELSTIEDDSGPGERYYVDYADDDDDDDSSSSLSVLHNRGIDSGLVYSIYSFAATVTGQASVIKDDSLFLMDDSNSYWWLVRVLRTQEVGYLPVNNIETPFERLARFNKHRNVDVRLLFLSPYTLK